MAAPWVESVPVLDHFSQVAEPGRYVALPDDWRIGVSDVVDSASAIAEGRYKAVNLAGAGTISAVANALSGDLQLFTFAGDGARFAIPPEYETTARDALSRTAMWAERDLGLQLRVGTTGVTEARAAGFDVRAAFWRASEHVRYAMFAGRGLDWAERQLKAGIIGLPSSAHDREPDLTGLSCQWGPIIPAQGKVLSLIIKPGGGGPERDFAAIVQEVIDVLEATNSLNPLPETGPPVRWPTTFSNTLQSRIARNGWPAWFRGAYVLSATALIWLVFRFGVRTKDFDPDRYRREITRNTDFRKFDDALMMTVDCAPETSDRLRAMLERAARRGVVRFGLHVQDQALMTCVVPSVLTADHMHFVDGAGGGYASAARQLADQTIQPN